MSELLSGKEFEFFPFTLGIFDYDGTIGNTEPDWIAAIALYLTSYHTPYSPDDHMVFITEGKGSLSRWIKERYNLPEPVEEIATATKAAYRLVHQDKVTAMPGAVELVRKLSVYMPIAIASHSHTDIITNDIAALGLEGNIIRIIGGDQIPFDQRKPHPHIYLKTAQLLEKAAVDCIVFEDSSSGVIAAKEAGMKCIVIPNQFTRHGDFTRADLMVRSLEDITIEGLKQFALNI